MITATLVMLALQGAQATQGSASAAPELGRVRFARDVDAGLKQSADAHKPVFLLFQEIPGCSTCQDFGAGPLSHPLLVEAIETLFVPVVVHNNEGGSDAAALERFHEPANNFPVVRYLSADGRDLLPRQDELWSAAEQASRMVAALAAAGQPAPSWLTLAAAELDTHKTERVVFAMRCFWEGQAALGALNGVVDAMPAFLGDDEVVDVRFVPAVLSFAELVRKADKLDCALRVCSPDAPRVAEARALVGERAQLLASALQAAPPGDDLHALKAVRKLDLAPLTRAQALRANAALARGDELSAGLLSPRQLAWSSSIERALAKKSAALDDLARPANVDQLAAYCDTLAARLGGG